MGKLISIEGMKVGKLTVIKRHSNDKCGRPLWLCQCECGNTCIVSGQRLRNGTTKSCGCLKHIPHTTTHGMSKTSLYNAWHSMKARCYSKNNASYKDYGGRGIEVCSEWLNSFECFMEWAINNGYKEGLSLDRKDVNSNYSPDNCRWADKYQQENNKRKTLKYTYNGETKSLAEWCRDLKINYNTTYQRIKVLGYSFEKAINYAS